MADNIFQKVEKSKAKKQTFEQYQALVQKIESSINPLAKVTTLPTFPYPSFHTFAYFGYFTEDTKNPFYDSFPFSFIINIKEDTFTGINFHYLHPKLRWKAVEYVLQGRNNIIPDKCFHQYRYDRLTTATYVCPLPWVKTGVLLSNELFRLTSTQAKIKSQNIWEL